MEEGIDMTNVKWYHRRLSVRGCVVSLWCPSSAFLPLDIYDSYCIMLRLKREISKSETVQ